MATLNSNFGTILQAWAGNTSSQEDWARAHNVTHNYAGSSTAAVSDDIYQKYNEIMLGGPLGRGDSTTTLKAIKEAIHKIKDEAVSESARDSIDARIDKYDKAGLKKQARILREELHAKVRLARIREWDYKVLPFAAIKKYHHSVVNGYYMDVHIDPIAEYSGKVEGDIIEGEYDKIVPEHVVDSLMEAQKRQVFDEYYVLWVEKVKDPLLLGKIKELPDYFLIDEWGDDVKLSDIVKEERGKKSK